MAVRQQIHRPQALSAALHAAIAALAPIGSDQVIEVLLGVSVTGQKPAERVRQRRTKRSVDLREGAAAIDLASVEPSREESDRAAVIRRRQEVLISVWESVGSYSPVRLASAAQKPSVNWLASVVPARLSVADLHALVEERPEIVAVTPNYTISVPEISPAATGASTGESDQPSGATLGGGASHSPVPGASWGVERIGAPRLWEEGLRGQGVRVAVLDTGVDAAHPDLLGRVTAFERYTPSASDDSQPQPFDPNGHGTSVCGIVAGGNGSGAHIGVAPDAELLVYRIFDDADSGTILSLVDGLKWAVEQGADVINISCVVNTRTLPDPLLTAIAEATIEGITVVVAAGNDGPGSAGALACGADVISVGAIDAFDHLAEFSATGAVSDHDDGPTPTLVAPGVAVLTARPHGQWGLCNGTSLAAPHVAGALSLLLSGEIGAQTGDARIDALLDALIERADGTSAVGPPYAGTGWGILRLVGQ